MIDPLLILQHFESTQLLNLEFFLMLDFKRLKMQLFNFKIEVLGFKFVISLATTI